MSIFTQRVNEHSSIIPSGFTGYIVRNSNVIIDKSYIKKGTSFVNAFDNTNVLIKDCGTPVPSVDSNLSQYLKLHKKIENETDRRLLPMWLHYKFNNAKFLNGISESDFEDFAASNEGEQKIGVIRNSNFNDEPYNKIKEYRDEMIASAKTDEGALPGEYLHGKLLVDYDKLLERQIISEGLYESKDIDYTSTGAFYLMGLTSSIKVVYPLNSLNMISSDNPHVVLNFKNREFIPTYALIDSSAVDESQRIYVANVDKTDKYGYKVKSDKSTTDSTDNYVGEYISTYVHKYIAKSSNSKPVSQNDDDTGSQIEEVIPVYNDSQVCLKIEGSRGFVGSDSNNKNFIMGPYLSNTVAYFKYDAQSNKMLINANQGSECTFYFKYKENVYSLFDVINGKIGSYDLSSNASSTDGTFLKGNDLFVYETFLKKNLDKFNTDYGPIANSDTFKIKNGSKRFPLDIITVNNVRDYQPDGNKESVKFIGFKTQTMSFSNSLDEGKFYNESGTDITVSLIESYLNQINSQTPGFVLKTASDFEDLKFVLTNNGAGIHTFINGFFVENDATTDDINEIFYKKIKYSIEMTYNVEVFANEEVKVPYTTRYYKITTSQPYTLQKSSTSYSGSYFSGSASSTSTYAKLTGVTFGTLQKSSPVEISSKKETGDKEVPTSTLSYKYEGKTRTFKLYASNESEVADIPFSSPSANEFNLISQFTDTEKNNLNRKIIDHISTSDRYATESNESSPYASTNNVCNNLEQLIPIIKNSLGIIEVTSSFSVETGVSGETITISPGYYIKNNSSLTGEHTAKIEEYYVKTYNKTDLLTKNYFPTSLTLATGDLTPNTFKVNGTPTFRHFSNGMIIPESGLQSYEQNVNNNDLSQRCNGFIEYSSFNPTGYLGTLEYTKFYTPQEVLNSLNTKVRFSSSSNTTTSFVLSDFLKIVNTTDDNSSFAYLTGNGYDSGNERIVIYPGKFLTTDIVSSVDSGGYASIILNVTLNNGSLNFSIDSTDYYASDEINYLELFYDRSCLNRVELGPLNSDRGGYSLYEYKAGKKEYVDPDNKGVIQNNVYVSYNYKTLKRFEYLTVDQYELENAKDWYNVNAYIDYNNVLLNDQTKYMLAIANFNKSTNKVTNSTALNTEFKHQFNNDNWVADYYNNAQQRIHTGSGYTHSFVFKDKNVPTPGTAEYEEFKSRSVASLFNTELNSVTNEFVGNKNFSYKAFSFNFKIPKHGWNSFNRKMYAENPYYLTDITTNSNSGTIDTETTPIAHIKNTAKTAGSFNGIFSFLYGVLDNRVVEQIVGTGNYGDGGYVDPNGEYHTGAKIDPNNIQMGGDSEKTLATAYNFTLVETPFQGKFDKGGDILHITSPNDTFAFTADFTDVPVMSGTVKYGSNSISITTPYKAVWVDIDGFSKQIVIKGITHHIIIPKIKLLVAKTVETSGTVPKIIISATAINGCTGKNSSAVITGRIYQPNNRASWHAGETLYSDSTYTDVQIHMMLRAMYNNDTTYRNAFGDALAKVFAGLNGRPNGKWVNDLLCDGHWWFGNMAPDERQDETRFPYTYLPLCSIVFTTSNNSFITGIRNSINADNALNWSEFCKYVPHKAIYNNNYTTYVNNYAFIGMFDTKYNGFVGCDKLAGTNATSYSPIRDAEQYVIPFDMSTNLLYYKGYAVSGEYSKITDKSALIGDDDEVIIINARKMYSEPDDIDTKPVGGQLTLDLSKLTETDIILTSLIRGNEETIAKFFDEVNVYVNNDLEYTKDSTKAENKRKCRYTDAHAEGLQWKLFELAKGTQFSTTNDFEIPLVPIQGNGKELSGEVVSVPARLTMTLSGLVFQQQCRYGTSFDNINDVLFDQRIFQKDVFGKSTTSNPLLPGGSKNTRFGLVQIGSSGATAVPSAVVNGDVVANSPYYLIKRPTSDLSEAINSIGGSNYFNDFYDMKINSNSANKWATYKQKTQFSKLLVYPDYNPRGDRIIGIPYLNQAGKIILREKIETGTSGGGQGIVKEIESVASLAKIATDVAYINPVLNVESIADYPAYPSSLTENVKILASELNSAQIGYNNLFTFIISGSIGNYNSYINQVGVAYFKMDEALFGDAISGTASNINSENAYPEFGIYFDGLPGAKEVILKNGETGANFKLKGDSTGAAYYAIGLNKSFVNLTESNGEGVFYGSISIQVSTNNPVTLDNFVEIHNFKLPSPIITSIGVSFSNEQKSELDGDGYYSLTDDIWQKQVIFNTTNNTIVETSQLFNIDNTGDSKIDYNDFRLYSSSTPGSELSGNSTVMTDDNGKITGLLLTVKIPGIKMFKTAGMKYFLENKQDVILSSQTMLDVYKKTFGIKYTDGANNGKYCLGDEYNQNAVIGSTVTSGTISNGYNVVETKPMRGKTAVGHLRYKYNPVDDDKFQLEVITKGKGTKYNKNIYFVNKKVDRWYNLSIYKSVIADETTPEQSIKLGFLLNDVNAETSGDISSELHEIFKCQVSNDSHIAGTSMKFALGYSDNLTNWKNVLFPSGGTSSKPYIQSYMKDWKSLYNINFNKCMRSLWNCKYTNDPEHLANSKDETPEEFKKRQNIDLFKISDSLAGLNFSNQFGEIRLFANAELKYAIGSTISNTSTNVNASTGTKPFYNMYVGNDFLDNTNFVDLPSTKWDSSIVLNKTGNNSTILSSFSKLRERLVRYYPRKIMYNDTLDNYILRKLTLDEIRPHIEGCEIMASNIMFISTPNLYNKATGVSYTESYHESLGAVNDYVEFFGNAQHRLPPVSYENRILDSDYATFIYANSKKYEAIETYNDVTNISETITYNYSENPSVISFTWGNSQVSRNETVGNNGYVSRLHWNKAVFNEYVSEVGSVYNFTDSQHVTNVISIETGSINERQCVLMPVISNPLEYEARSKEEGVVKVVDNIIATSALGYNSLGYPKNGILSYNTNGNVYIDSRNRNFIYIEQLGSSSSCNLGATIQKPVFIDSVSQNIQSLNETFSFLPNPDISKSILDGTDEGVQMTEGGTMNGDTIPSNDAMLLFNGRTIGISQNAFLATGSDEGSIVGYEDVVTNDNILYYTYPPDDNIKELDKNENTITKNRNVKYLLNTFAMPEPKVGDNDAVIPDKHALNVFYDENGYNTLLSELGGTIVRTNLETVKCFNYDGELWDLTSLPDGFALANPGFANYYYNGYLDVRNKIKNDSTISGTCEFELCPIIAAIWGDKTYMPDLLTYNAAKEINIEQYRRNRHAVMDEYCAVNLSSIRFKISASDLKSAPIYIEIRVLKYDVNTEDFYWEADPSLDLDIRDTYESVYDSGNPGDVYVDKVFVDDGRALTKDVYGVKMMIKSIVPQSETFNSCKIANIQILVSNYLNPYGLSRSVEDVYVRRADANYSTAYDVKCSEYIWRLPNSSSEWQAVLTSLKGNLVGGSEIDNSINTIESYVSNYINGTANEELIDTYMSSNNFSRVNTYYISNNLNQGNEISEILSDNYLVDSNIQISWKYIDYVYIYYSCYSFNAKELLDMYFGDKIYAAVRAKLINNINNMNANSAFGDRYRFGGGIAVQKEFSLNTQTKSAAFEWKADVRYDTLTTYQDTYQTDWTKVDVYERTATKRSTYYSGHGFGSNYYGGSTIIYGSPFLASSTTTSETHLAGTNVLGQKTTRHYLGSTLQNSKYSSVDNWTKSFSPRQIKYKIN